MIETQSAWSFGQVHFQQVLEKIPAGVYMCDAGGLITYFNAHAVRLWGRAPSLGNPVDRYCGSFKLFSAEGTPISHDECWMAQAIKTKQELNGREIVVERPNGDRHTVLAHATPICDESGRLLGAVNILVDISARKGAENALLLANNAKSKLLATLANEVRTSLAPIRDAVHVLRDEVSPSPELQWGLDVIERQLTQVNRLIDELLDVTNISRDTVESQNSEVRLTGVIQSVLEAVGR